MRKKGGLRALLHARIEEAIKERRDVLGGPAVNLDRVRAYFRERGGDDLAALPDALLSVAVHLARILDPTIAPVDRARSEAWLWTEGVRLTADPAVRAVIESIKRETASWPN